MPDKPLSNRVVIITGGAGGMGTVMTLALLEDGAWVAVVDNQEERVQAMARSTAGVADEGALITLTADITKTDDCERVTNAVLDRFGRVDALVNAAGIGMQTVRSNYMSEPVRFWEVEPERWQAVMDVNWKGAFLMARAVTPHLVKQGSGRIVNVTTSLDTMFRGAYTPYGMSKGRPRSRHCKLGQGPGRQRRHRQRAGSRRTHQHELHPRKRTLRPQQAGATRGHGRSHPVARVRRVPEHHRLPLRGQRLGYRAGAR